MQIVGHVNEIETKGRPVCVAIGVFDGVHLGHQRVISAAVEKAQATAGLSVVVTFDVHPATVLAPERAPKFIQPLGQRLREISKLGADVALVHTFTREFSQVPAHDFIRGLVRDLKPLVSIAVGETFSFGHKRSGNVQSLREWSGELGYNIDAISPVHAGGAAISSTRIRAAIREGNLDEIRLMLGRPYSLRTPVQQGDRLGRKLGFPTANLDVKGLELLPFGVYAGYAQIDGVSHKAVANLGIRPSVTSYAVPRFEVHILDFARDLYGAELEFTAHKQLRLEKKFANVEELIQQIARDVEQTRELLAIGTSA